MNNITNTGVGQWHKIGEKKGKGIDIFPFLPCKNRTTCNEVCVWCGHGYEGAASRCTLQEFIGGKLHDLIVSDHGEIVLNEVIEFVKKEIAKK